LRDALADSNNRLVIIAPWVKNSVVDAAFIGGLERLVRRKVKIHIAYGIGNDDHGSNECAISRLRNLADRFKDDFTFVRLKNSHAKILISDETWINTSFTGYRSGGTRTERTEWKKELLIRSQKHVDEAYDKYLRMIEEQKSSP
jgi:hypothetical protein